MSPVELPTLRPEPSAVASPIATISRDRYERLAHRVRLLSWLSLDWMTIEGAVSSAVSDGGRRGPT
jgi:hypothetical protein